jgi:hypothetical protein
VIRVPIKNKEGVYRTMRTRVPRTRTFALYRQAQTKTPDLIEAIYKVLAGAVEAHPEATSHRASSLIAGIPADWSHAGRWLEFSASEAERRSLFEQILWTYFFDRSETWETTWPEPGEADAVYVAVATEGPTARGSLPVREAAAHLAETASRGLRPAAAAAPPELKPRDVVEIVDGDLRGFRGRVLAVSTGVFRKVDLELFVDGVLRPVEGFRISQVRKLQPGE